MALTTTRQAEAQLAGTRQACALAYAPFGAVAAFTWPSTLGSERHPRVVRRSLDRGVDATGGIGPISAGASDG